MTVNILRFIMVEYKVTIILFLTMLCCATNATLRRRLLTLETRVALDAIEFRNDISDLQRTLNETCIKEDMEEQVKEKGTCRIDDGSDNDDVRKVNHVTTVVRKGFMEEKAYLRKSRKNVYSIIETLQNSVAMNSKRNKIIFSKIRTHENILKRLTNFTDAIGKDMNAVIDTLSTRANSIETTSEHILQLKEEIVQQSNKVRATEITAETLMKDVNETKGVISCQVDGWMVYKKSCYKLMTDTLPWVDAVNSCTSMGGYLTETDDDDEFAYTVTLAKTFDVGRDMWLGASDIAEEGVFIWNRSKKKIDDIYTAWKRGEPNGNVNESCLSIQMYTRAYKWNDLPCNTARPYLCEKEF